ncbi:AAA family ATPase [Allofustis seminis]|uniref:AAA family ATPase n=1 Tax=Allofustis seminis TaxID=166939 RepID=UPI0003A5CA2C|nr:AAA family ATPase [Allofustis seminis]
MAKYFYIKSIQSISKKGKISKVDFVNGFNLIHGPSNTGKTLILKCIDYLFGASKVDGLDNQDYLVIDLVCENGFIQIKRYLEENKNKVYLTSSIPDIESGEYPLVSKTKTTLSDIFLTLLGIDQLPIKVIKNENFATQNLTWRTFLHIFFLKESEILREGSILDSKTNTSLTAFRSSLLFLINGEDQAPLEKEESPDSIKLKNQAVRAYVNNKLKKISEEESKISENLKNISKEEAEKHLNDALHQVNYNNDALSKITQENKRLTEENTSLFVEREENSVSIRNFKELIAQYKIDLNRLSFIVEGHKPMHTHEEETSCPFCDAKMTKEDDLVNLESVATELKNIQIKLKDLTATLELLEEEDIALEKKINSNHNTINQNSYRINKILAPAIKELEDTIREYNTYFNLQTEKATLRKMASEWNEDLSDYDDDKIEDNKYKPLDRLPKEFFRNMSTILETNLEKCSFPHLSSARFDKTTFDVVINGEPKSSQGKGYRAYLNSIVSLSMLEYLDINARYPIPLFIVDTPLLGLDEAIAEKQATEANLYNMRYAFYKFLIEIGNHKQIILIDNNKNLPKVDWKEYSLHTVEFTKNESFGRYGFLEGVTD